MFAIPSVHKKKREISFSLKTTHYFLFFNVNACKPRIYIIYFLGINIMWINFCIRKISNIY